MNKTIKRIIRQLFGVNELNKKIDNLQYSINALFKYQTKGLELFPEKDERIIVYDYNKAKPDHLSRYYKSIEFINKNDNVLDVACGVGYGSRFIRDFTDAAKVTGVDISLPAINYAKNIFWASKLEFINASATDPSLFKKNTFNVIISFETIEHIQESNLLLSNYFYWLKTGGRLICSSPNEEIKPFNPENNPFHVRHYSPEDFTMLIEKAGFTNFRKYKQKKDLIVNITDQTVEGEHLYFVAEKSRKRL